MPFPQTFDGMKAASYIFDAHARCRGCGQETEFWITPHGKKIAMDLMPNADSPAVSDLGTCPDAPLFGALSRSGPGRTPDASL